MYSPAWLSSHAPTSASPPCPPSGAPYPPRDGSAAPSAAVGGGGGAAAAAAPAAATASRLPFRGNASSSNGKLEETSRTKAASAFASSVQGTSRYG